jgi:hypothetical protein
MSFLRLQFCQIANGPNIIAKLPSTMVPMSSANMLFVIWSALDMRTSHTICLRGRIQQQTIILCDRVARNRRKRETEVEER